MSSQDCPGIYLIVEFDWPRPMGPDNSKNAYALHQMVQNRGSIQEIVAASGGVGSGPGSIWIFWLENYSALDRLLRDKTDDVSKAFITFFNAMPKVNEKIREEVVFG